MSISLKKPTHAVRLTQAVRDTIKGTVADDPVAKQYLPQETERKILPVERRDPIGDDVHTPVKGIVHRYPDRVLFKVANACAVYCRYCFRKEMIGPGTKGLSQDDINAALQYIRSHNDIWEVILTGGDPLVLSPRQLSAIIDNLCAIPHVQVVRIHTRVPVADPQRMTDELCAALNRDKAVYVAIHINHAQEITDDVRRALKSLHAAGCVLLSQSVLLKGVNDNAAALENLFRQLTALRVKPYYLHHPDLAPGTSHFRGSIKRGQQIMKELLGRLSGIAQPTYMLDIPGGFGKVPLTPQYLNEIDDSLYTAEDYQSCTHHYPPKE